MEPSENPPGGGRHVIYAIELPSIYIWADGRADKRKGSARAGRSLSRSSYAWLLRVDLSDAFTGASRR